MTLAIPSVPGVTHRDVEVDGVRFHVAEAGAGEPLVMLHGWPQNWYMWRRLVEPLASRYRLVMPDLRGFGWSEAPRGSYTKERFATDVLGIVDKLGVDDFRLIGHDWGGLTSFLVALRAPQRVRRLMVLNMIHPWPSPVAMLFNLPKTGYMIANAVGLGGKILRDNPERFEGMLRATLVRKDAFSDEDLRIYLDPLAAPDHAHVNIQVYRQFLVGEVPGLGLGRYRSRRLPMPTLLLFGEEDAAVNRRMLNGYEGHADDMRVELVPNCGHFIVDEQPQLVADRAIEFFAA